MENKISIIIPVYKIREDFLRCCAESIVRQTCPNWEVIFVDDGSPDQCGQICDEIAETDERFKVVHQVNQGVSVARNTGVVHAAGNWIAFVDPDDWVEPKWIEAMYSAINEKDCDIVMYDYWREFKEENKLECFFNSSQRCEGTLLEDLRNGPFFKLIQNGRVNPYATPAIWNKLYKKSFLEKKRLCFLPEAKKAQDRLFNARALQCTAKIDYLHQPFYHYRCFGDSVTNRYNLNIVGLTCIQLKELGEIIEEFHLSEKTRDYLNARICTRVYSCLRLYIFHPNNMESTNQKFQEIRQLIGEDPFKSAFKNVQFSLLSKHEKVFVFCLKSNLLWIIKLMVNMKNRELGKKLQE